MRRELVLAAVGVWALTGCGAADPSPPDEVVSFFQWQINDRNDAALGCPAGSTVEMHLDGGAAAGNVPCPQGLVPNVYRDVHRAWRYPGRLILPGGMDGSVYPETVTHERNNGVVVYRYVFVIDNELPPTDGGPVDATRVDALLADTTPFDAAPSDATRVDAPEPDAPAPMDAAAPDVVAVDAPDVPAVVDVVARDRGDVPACPNARLFCDGMCRDVANDSSHCGDCGVACPAGRACVFGECRAPCTAMGTCADPALACGGSFPRYCMPPACVNTTNAACGGACANLFADRANCGFCGNVCPAGQDCVLGTCGNCPAGATPCGGECVDLQTRFQHCGRCGNACPTGGRCSAGVCGCFAGATLCGSLCAELSTNRAHCGACDRACGAAERCQGGACVPACPSGQTLCTNTAMESTCVDTQTNPLHCGRCNNPCGTGRSCRLGVCDP